MALKLKKQQIFSVCSYSASQAFHLRENIVNFLVFSLSIKPSSDTTLFGTCSDDSTSFHEKYFTNTRNLIKTTKMRRLVAMVILAKRKP